MKAKVIVMLLAISLASGAEDAPRTKPATTPAVTVGAIRWDAWFNGKGSRQRYQKNFTPDAPKWHGTLPFFAKVVSRTEVEVFADRQEVMDREIAHAKAAGLSYWAFLYYRPGVAADGFDHDKMNIGRRLYLASRHKADVNFCLIIYPCDGKEWRATVADVARLVKEPTYQTVAGGRPLIYLLAWGEPAQKWAADKNNRRHIDSLRSEVRKAAGANPYIVVQAMRTAGAVRCADNLHLDAISAYAVWGGRDYPGLDLSARRHWAAWKATGRKVVPLAMAGWGGARGGTLQQPTPEQLAAHLTAALRWVRDNPGAAEARTVLFYAWNEFDEGGYLAPTKGEGAARIEALARVLRPAPAGRKPPPPDRR